MKIGYIGMGIMGSAMAMNLVKAGFEVTVFNRTASKCAPLVEVGATHAVSVADLARVCEVICVNVTDTPDVEQVLLGKAGLIHHARPGTIVIDHSTIDPVQTQAMAKKLRAKRITLLDAPVTGGDVGARSATLSIMVGGDAKALAKVMPILSAVGKSVVHMGKSGSGQSCKACNQLAVLLTLAGVCEAIKLAKKSKINPKQMLEVVGAGAGASWQLANLGPRILAGDFKPGFMIELARKDFGIVVDTARSLGLELPGAKLIAGQLKALVKQGLGKQGTQALFKLK
jgi:3-hydroxyisobutyrate dehydrogenase